MDAPGMQGGCCERLTDPASSPRADYFAGVFFSRTTNLKSRIRPTQGSFFMCKGAHDYFFSFTSRRWQAAAEDLMLLSLKSPCCMAWA